MRSLALSRCRADIGRHRSRRLAAQCAIEQLGERCGELPRRPRPGFAEPFRHPVERSEDREYRELRIARHDAAVLDAFAHQVTQRLLEAITILYQPGALP